MGTVSRAVLALVVPLVVGCGSESNAAHPTPKVSPQVFPAGTAIPTAEGTFTLVSTRLDSAGNAGVPPSRGAYLVITATYQHRGPDVYHVTQTNFLGLSEYVKPTVNTYVPVPPSQEHVDHPLLDFREMKPGESITADVVFEIFPGGHYVVGFPSDTSPGGEVDVDLGVQGTGSGPPTAPFGNG